MFSGFGSAASGTRDRLFGVELGGGNRRYKFCRHRGSGLNFEHTDRATGRYSHEQGAEGKNSAKLYSLRVNFRVDTDSDNV